MVELLSETSSFVPWDRVGQLVLKVNHEDNEVVVREITLEFNA